MGKRIAERWLLLILLMLLLAGMASVIEIVSSSPEQQRSCELSAYPPDEAYPPSCDIYMPAIHIDGQLPAYPPAQPTSTPPYTSEFDDLHVGGDLDVEDATE